MRGAHHLSGGLGVAYQTSPRDGWSIGEGESGERTLSARLAVIASDEDLPYFLVGYAAVCVLVGIDRTLLFDVAQHGIIQRKLNEAFRELRIPRKQFTRVFEAFIEAGKHWGFPTVVLTDNATYFTGKHRG